MQEAVEAALPADIAVMAAAVADWRAEASAEKIKKDGGGARLARAHREPRHPRRSRPPPSSARASSSASRPRPRTCSPTPQAKLKRKGADWIVANDVSPETGIMGGTRNRVHLVTADGRRGLAGDDEGRGGGAARRADRRAALPNRRRERADRDASRGFARSSASMADARIRTEGASTRGSMNGACRLSFRHGGGHRPSRLHRRADRARAAGAGDDGARPASPS